MAAEHSNLLNKVMLKLSTNGFKIWRNETGVAKSMDGSRVIRYGLVGSTDIIGTAPNGLSVYAEIKIPPDDLKPEQIIFKNVMIAQGAIYAKITPENFDNEVERISREGQARASREF